MEQAITVQTMSRPEILHVFEVHLSTEINTLIEPIMASPRDYGFDFDGEQLARELLAPNPLGDNDTNNPVVGAEEFETLYKWFNA